MSFALLMFWHIHCLKNVNPGKIKKAGVNNPAHVANNVQLFIHATKGESHV